MAFPPTLSAPSGDASETIAAQMNSVKSQASISFNMISVALTSLGMGYYVSKTAGLSESHVSQIIIRITTLQAYSFTRKLLQLLEYVYLLSKPVGTNCIYF